jgi:ElaB/YqjD/DUF883 family membrane-anchored ribosome-binding protein
MNELGREEADEHPEALRAEIRATRADLSETVNAIQEKLNPQRIKDEAVSTVREATVGRVEDMAEDAKWKVKGVGYDVIDTIKRNPVPAALAAIGLGWLFMEGRSRSERDYGRYGERRGYGERDYRDRRYGSDRYYYADDRSNRSGYAYDEYGRRYDVHGDYERDPRSRVAEAGSAVKEKASEVVGQAASKVQDVAGDAKETAGQVVESARQGVQQVAYEAQYRAERVGSRFGEMMQDNPLLIGAAAAALGAVVGFAFPSTEKENELLGEARDKVMERAQEVASETAHKVQRVAEEATSAAKEAVKSEAEKQNLSTGSRGTSGFSS